MFIKRLLALLFGWIPVRRKTYDQAIREWAIADFKYALLNTTFYFSAATDLWDLKNDKPEHARRIQTLLQSYWQRIKNATTDAELYQIRTELGNFKLKFPELGIK